LDRRFIASLHSQAAIIYRKPNAECALLGGKLSNAKIQLKIPCNARPEAFDFLAAVSTPAAIKALKVQKLTSERNYAHANSYG
jgi:hypothetical protein